MAGTAFARVGDGDTETDGGTDTDETVELRNRTFVFGPDGRLACTQDKVHLTEFEAGVLGLSPGQVVEAAPFMVAGARIGLTLCRDSFFDPWEERFRGLDLAWGGESSVVECADGAVMVRVSASSAREPEILRAEIGGTEGGMQWRK